MLIYHRVGGGSGDELDLSLDSFREQADALGGGGHDVISLDQALDRLDAGDRRPTVVLTFDDGFADVHERAFPILQERSLPFTLYLAAGLVGGEMRWEGSAAGSQGARALNWDDIAEMQRSGLCTVGNHTWDHAGPEVVDEVQLDRCSDAIEASLGERPSHFAWTWGVPVPGLRSAVSDRFRSAATGQLGRNLPGTDLHALRRIPVRASDPLRFFEAKLSGGLGPERAYAGLVRAGKAMRRAGRHG